MSDHLRGVTTGNLSAQKARVNKLDVTGRVIITGDIVVPSIQNQEGVRVNFANVDATQKPLEFPTNICVEEIFQDTKPSVNLKDDTGTFVTSAYYQRVLVGTFVRAVIMVQPASGRFRRNKDYTCAIQVHVPGIDLSNNLMGSVAPIFGDGECYLAPSASSVLPGHIIIKFRPYSNTNDFTIDLGATFCA